MLQRTRQHRTPPGLGDLMTEPVADPAGAETDALGEAAHTHADQGEASLGEVGETSRDGANWALGRSLDSLEVSLLVWAVWSTSPRLLILHQLHCPPSTHLSSMCTQPSRPSVPGPQSMRPSYQPHTGWPRPTGSEQE